MAARAAVAVRRQSGLCTAHVKRGIGQLHHPQLSCVNFHLRKDLISALSTATANLESLQRKREANDLGLQNISRVDGETKDTS